MTSKKTSRYLEMEAVTRTKVFITWSEVEFQCRNLHSQIKDHRIGPHLKTIIAIARGGMVPATMLAHALGTQRLQSISISSYVNDLKKDLVVDPIPDYIKSICNESTVLFVDDIVDSGATLGFIKSTFPKAHFASMITKAPAIYPDYFCASIRTSDDWVVFPWEKTS